jgi:hypothetical protein
MQNHDINLEDEQEILTIMKESLSKETHYQSDTLMERALKKRNYSVLNIDLEQVNTNTNRTPLKEKKYYDLLEENFNNVSPLIYLSVNQRKAFLNDIIFYQFEDKETLYTQETTTDHYAYILLEGGIGFFEEAKFLDFIDVVNFFGYDGPVFKKRLNTAIVEKNSIVAFIPEKTFIENLIPFSKFCTFISRSIIHKDKVLDHLLNFKNFVIQKIDQGVINLKEMIDLYTKIDSCLHPKVRSEEMDLSAWFYALHRLPENVLETFVSVLVNKPPKKFLSNEDYETIAPIVNTKGRLREVYKLLNGKNLIVVREMETDVLDFVSNSCIHYIESLKLKKKINDPVTLARFFEHRNCFEKTCEILGQVLNHKFDHGEKEGLRKYFGTNLAETLIKLVFHYQDTVIYTQKVAISSQDPSEKWIQNLWKNARELLGITSSVEEVDDLIVDISQGSKTTLLAALTPHLYKNKEKILKWAVDNNIQLKTKTFLAENDKLIAYSYYYYKTFPEERNAKEQMEKDCGVRFITETFSTGIQVLLIDVNKLNPDYSDPAFRVKPASKNHIILHFGYTFGAQSSLIIKPLLMLFGSKARSMNIIGKAGGLVGNRTDILVSSNIFYDKTNELININHGGVDVELLKKETNSDVHLGPMLNVAGTILQNCDLLNFYKNVQGCIGLEMEGFFFVREIESCIKCGILKPEFLTRCFYYASDLPLDPNQNLAQESGNVSWEEGVCSMNAIQRYVLKKIFQ